MKRTTTEGGDLAGRVVLVTGAARRLGRLMALGCAEAGADVIVHHRRSESEAEELATQIRALGRAAWVAQNDLATDGGPAALARFVQETAGRLDVLVNSAAGFPTAPFEEITPADFRSILETNLVAPAELTRQLLPLLRAARPGHVVNLTDWAVARPYARYAAYMASKGGLETLTKALARELAPHILVNALAPGPTLPPEEPNPALEKKIESKAALGRWADPRDLVRALLFLLGSTEITGITITVDAGRTIG